MKRLRLAVSILTARNYCVVIERKGGGMSLYVKNQRIAKRAFYELSRFLRMVKD